MRHRSSCSSLAALLGFVTVVIIVMAAFLLVIRWYEARQDRDEARREAIRQTQEMLQSHYRSNAIYPKANGNLPERTGGLAGLPQAVTLPQSGDRLYYTVTPDGSTYAACIQLETQPVAVFASADVTFEVPRRHCQADTDPVVAGFVVSTTMTSQAAALFYDGQPQILAKERVQEQCAGSVHGDAQLAGCFTGQIYIMNYEQPEIRPEMHVTAAHEMLHAAYQALPSRRRAELDSHLTDTAKAANDPDLNKYLEQYSPEQRGNELHSVIGTEYGTLPPDLENHYRQYFRDRTRVVAAHQQYKSVLDRLEREIDELRARLDSLNVRANRLREAGDFGSYNTLVAEHNRLVPEINAKIDRYNELTEHTRPSNAKEKTPTR